MQQVQELISTVTEETDIAEVTLKVCPSASMCMLVTRRLKTSPPVDDRSIITSQT
jgi:hypothetical protein